MPAEHAPRAPLPAGRILAGRYRIASLLARGGMSVVYRAHTLDMPPQAVAIKQMRVADAPPAARARAAAQMRYEGDLLARLSHPALVEVVDVFREDDEQFLVMPLIHGRDLESMRREGPAPVTAVLDWFEQLCAVLGWLHSQSPPVVYRDLTPRNVMCEPGGRLRLLDFGLARRLGSDDDTATFVKGAGTPGYAPIEQCGVGTTDTRSDVHALGATMYAMLTGRTPPPSRDRLANEPLLVPPSLLRPDAPPALTDLIVTCMALHPRQRPQSIAAVQAALNAVTAAPDKPPRDRPAAADERTPAETGPVRWMLRVTEGADRGGRYVLTCRAIDLGRGDPLLASPEHLYFLDSSVSRAQASLAWEDAAQRYIIIHDPRATNPTRVNGTRVTRQMLEHGDAVVMGRLQLQVEAVSTDASADEANAGHDETGTVAG